MAIELRAGGCRAVILPGAGGRLHQLFVAVEGREEPLLHSPADPAEYAARPTRGGSFPMAPWPNRVAGSRFRWQGREFALPAEGKANAIHGRVFAAAWETVRVAPAACELRAGLDDGWPWPGEVVQRFVLERASLQMEMEIATSREPFPAGGGWHPWFRRDVRGSASVALQVPAAERYVLEAQLPTGERVAPEGDRRLDPSVALGERRLDDCYTALGGPARITWERLALTITVECAAPHLMGYTPPEALCVEPQSCAPDAFNLDDRGVSATGAAVAEPGRPVRIASTWRWEG